MYQMVHRRLHVLKAEVAKTSSVAAEVFPGSNQDFNIVSSTSDLNFHSNKIGTSFWRKKLDVR